MKNEFDFALTTYCQARCRSCARTNQDTGEKEDWLELKHMNLDTYKGIINSSLFKNKKDIEVVFCGEFGDPMMHPQVSDFIDVTVPVVRRLVINTNGGLRNPEWYANTAKKFNTKDSKLEIHWGIDGTDHDTNWLYREGVDWTRAMDNMRSWFGNSGRGTWHFLIFEWNWHQIPEANQMAKDIGCAIEFKFNRRSYGKISEENKGIAYELLESEGVL